MTNEEKIQDLEQRLKEAEHKLEIENAQEKCSQCGFGWHPSLVESGWCIFCICKDKEKRLTLANAQIAVKDEALKQISQSLIKIEQLVSLGKEINIQELLQICTEIETTIHKAI